MHYFLFSSFILTQQLTYLVLLYYYLVKSLVGAEGAVLVLL